jgi:hypothetical protein
MAQGVMQSGVTCKMTLWAVSRVQQSGYILGHLILHVNTLRGAACKSKSTSEKLEGSWTSSKPKLLAAQKLDGDDPALNQPSKTLPGCPKMYRCYLIHPAIADSQKNSGKGGGWPRDTSEQDKA